MTKQLNLLIAIIVSLLLFAACEDVIDVELLEGETALVVDAWVDNLAREQVISLTLSQPFFDNSLPTGIEDAVVTIQRSDDSQIVFTHRGDGQYIYDGTTTTIGEIGEVLDLSIVYQGVTYSATSRINRVPTIDSIGVEFRENEIFSPDGLYAQFFSREPVGLGDTYWIRTFANGDFLNSAQELNIAFDAGFDGGAGVDGIIFIPPIRELTNRLDGNGLPIPYIEGDTVLVEIHSISNEGFRFLETARDQISNGDNGLFSIPQANTRTNVTAEGGLTVLGFFNVAGVSESTRVIGE